MKTFKKVVIISLVAVLAAAMTVFFAACAEEPVTISFETNGGAALAPVTVEPSKEIDLPTPKKEGSLFDGWYKSASLEGQAITGKVTATENTTYYAKWTNLYTLTLDAAGGTVATTSFTMKAGDNVYDKVKDTVPTYAHHEFVGWYDGTKAVTASSTMPASALTLTASYKTEYTIEVWTQKQVDGTEYVKSDEVKGYEKVGKNFVAEYDKKGYTAVDNQNARTEGRIDEDYTKNVFKLYFDVQTFKVTFYSNYPDGTGLAAENKMDTYLYGDKIAAPYDLFSVDGYVLIGWADSLTGGVKYKVDYLSTMSTNVVGATASGEEITVEKNTSLFAVWKKGFYNLFGGSDLIYYPDETSSDIYLERGGLYFKGTYIVRSNYFDFSDKNGNVMLEGKFMDAEGNDVTAATLSSSAAAFAVRNEERDTSSYNLYKVGTGINKFTHIIFDEYNGVTYGGQNQIPSEGTYYIDANGFYVINYHSGPLADTSMVVRTDDSGDVKTFRVRNEDEVAFGTLSRGVVVGGELRFYNAEVTYGLTMDGFGNATYDNGGATVRFTYASTETENEYTLLLEDSEVGTIRVFNDGNLNYYMFYDAQHDKVYTVSDTASLTLDGVKSLVFTDGDKTVEAYYTLASSAMGGNIVVFYDSTGKQYLFLINAITVNDGLDDATQSHTEYVAYEKAANYAEYYFKDGANIYYGPMVVFNGEDGGDILAEVWMRTAAGKMEKVSDGIVTTNPAGRYVYTERVKTAVEDAADRPIDFATVKSFEFEVGALSRNGSVYNVNYWYAYTDNDDNEYTNTVTYGTGDKTFTVIMPLGAESPDLLLSDTAVYYDGKDYYKGVYVVGDDKSISLRCNVAVQTAYGQSTYEQVFYFRINDGQLTVLEGAPHRIALRKPDGNYDNKYLYFDGESGKATLVEIDISSGEITSSTDGTFAETGTTSVFGHVGYVIYTFTAQGIEPVDYVVYTQAKEAFFIRYGSGLEIRYPAGSGIGYLYNADYSGQFTSDYGYLILDGFGVRAIYSSDDGETVAGYLVDDSGVLIMHTGDPDLYFDLNAADKTFTARGKEFGVYTLYDNNFAKDVRFDLDGYGKLTVYKTVGESKQFIDQNGTYVYNAADNSITLDYNGGSDTAYEKGFLLTVSANGGYMKAFVPFNDEPVGTYINNKNWSVLVLDSAGRAYSYDKNGFMSVGRFTLVTENLLYFADDNGKDGSVFNYDKDTRVISVFSATQRAYYTADFKSLIFYKNGFVVINGEKVGYFAVDNGQVVIFRQTGDNKYGFTADNSFGTFTDESDYLGDHYYNNSGYSLTFTHDTAAESYKLALGDTLVEIGDLYFTPPGTEYFANVLGDIRVGSEKPNCVITRTADNMFVTLNMSDGSSYRIYISADYRGSLGSTYSITGIERVSYIYSSKYLTNYFMYYYYYGSAAAQSYANNYGTIEIVDTYNENGEVIDSYAEGKFGSASGFNDYNGNPLTFKAAYELRKEVSAGTDLYIVSYLAPDGFKYNVYFIVGTHPYMGRPAYLVSYFGREEVVSSADGVYEVTIERIAATDMDIELGSLSDVNVKKSGEKLERYAAALIDGVIYFIVKSDSATTYYFIEVKYENNGEIGNADSILKIATVEVTEKAATTYKTEDGADYVDFVDGKLIVMSVTTSAGKKTFIITGYEYDDVTDTYTVTTSDNVYTLKIVDNKAVITFTDEGKDKEGEKDKN